jgi:TatD DNase family protein
MLIDSHLHLPNDPGTASEIIERAKTLGVTKFVNIGTSLADSKKAVKTAGMFPEVFASVAVYPHEDLDRSVEEIETDLRNIINSSEKIVAVGECGIDISNWEDGRELNKQVELFEKQVLLSKEFNLPLIIHNRNGDEQVLNVLKAHKDKSLTGVLHCFASTWEFASKILDLGFYISFSGMITYPSRKDLLETVKKVPSDRILVETDSPYLPPQGHRGEKNEPRYVKIVASKVAEVRGMPLELVEHFTYENTSRLFKI